MAELLGGVARRSAVVLLIEDVHWADTATLDLLTYLARAGRDDAVTVVVTCRSDEVPLDAAVADWLTHVRRDAEVEEIRLGLLSEGEVAEQVTALVGAAPPGELVEEVYARTEGHPFFTEQLVAAAVTDAGQLAQPVALPARLAELLVARAARCGGDARAMLNALAVAGRPLTEVMLGEVTSMASDAVVAAVHELAEARLLAVPANVRHRPRHALLAEAVTAELLPGERVSLHERLARALEDTGDEALAAEAAGHWAAAGRPAEELRARLAAANAAEQVFAYADAATHWQRAIELCQAMPGNVLDEGINVPRLYIDAVDALEVSGNSVLAGVLADEAYRRFADHHDRATAALIHFRAGRLRATDSPATGGPLMKEALRLFEGTPPSYDHARAWLGYALDLLWVIEGRHPAEIHTVLESGLEVAEAAGAVTVTAPILCMLAMETFLRGDLEKGFRLLAQARSVLGESRDAWALLALALFESDALLKVGRLEDATRVGLRGFDDAGRLGFGSTGAAAISLANAVEALLGRGHSAEAAALIDPLINRPIEPDNWPLHLARADIDLVRGELDAATDRMAKIDVGASPEFVRELGQDVAEVALWARRPEDALEAVWRALGSKGEADWLMKCGWLLALGMRACADMAEGGRARRDDNAVRATLGAADELASWVDREHEVPFTAHPYMAELSRLPTLAGRRTPTRRGSKRPGRVECRRGAVGSPGYRHRAGYCWWRHAEAQLAAGRSPGAAAGAVRTAAAAAEGHEPLLAEIRALARRARISLETQPTTAPPERVAPVSTSYGLTERELDVLRLLTHGRSNAEIGVELFISPRTAGVHVTNILRKLGVSNRVQAAALAERAELFTQRQPEGPLAHP